MVSLYLVRHAIAEQRGSDYPDDAVRPLTREGKSRMKAVVAGFRALDPGVELILTSPLARADATARILRNGLDRDVPVEVCAELAPDHAPEVVAAALDRYRGRAALALVGHEPDLGLLASWLTGADEPPPFKKGGICRIDVAGLPPRARGCLIWHATPRMLRGLA